MSSTRLLAKIRREFREHPGIVVTLRQAQIRWSLDKHQCSEALNALLAEGFLRRVDDAYLWTGTPVPRFRRSPGHGYWPNAS